MCIFGVYCISTDGWTKFRAFGNQREGRGGRAHARKSERARVGERNSRTAWSKDEIPRIISTKGKVTRCWPEA